jgi:hypothetical protein
MIDIKLKKTLDSKLIFKLKKVNIIETLLNIKKIRQFKKKLFDVKEQTTN